ncbi:MAG: cation:proton antiporter [Gemmatimonadota bacterium]|nr:MAG: cation:proton antiporter [Gemmatimonadota bacterium]
MDTFSLLLDIVVALGAALTLGLLLARLGQSPIVGYLLAGVLIGPHALALLRAVDEVRGMAELGVALLLFTIGLELPWRRLRILGFAGVGTGVLQILLTVALLMVVALPFRVPVATGAALGLVFAFSSTAVVFRVLTDRAELDSVPGRVSVGILLVQDIAVIPALILLPVLAAGLGGDAPQLLGGALVRGLVLIAAFVVLAKTLMPVLLSWAAAIRVHELFVILALTFCLGATWAAHALGLSPVLGAFLAGVLLADSPFSNQMRVEVGSLRSGFLALFFVSIGMLADPAWMVGGAPLLAGVVVAIVAVKAVIAAGVVRLFGYSGPAALVVGLTLAHIGELSFVVAEVGRGEGLIDAGGFQLVVSAAVLTLLLAPYLVVASRHLASLAGRGAARPELSSEAEAAAAARAGHVIVVGCGPTGSRVVEALRDVGSPYLVIELNAQTVRKARGAGTEIEFGDASQAETLRHAGVGTARALIVTVPDPASAAAIIEAARTQKPDLPIVARARYARHAHRLIETGADALLNEEVLMGEHLAALSLKLLGLAAEGVARVEPPGGTTPSPVPSEPQVDLTGGNR